MSEFEYPPRLGWCTRHASTTECLQCTIDDLRTELNHKNREIALLRYSLDQLETWVPVETLPPVSAIDIYAPTSSGPVLVFRKDGQICVARYETWDVAPYAEDEPCFHWTTDDSEGWRIDDEVTHWMKLPKKPIEL